MLPQELFDRIPRELDVINFDTNKSVIQIFDKMEFYCKELSGEAFRRVLMHLIEEVFLNIIIEFELYLQGKPCRYEVTEEVLKTMA